MTTVILDAPPPHVETRGWIRPCLTILDLANTYGERVLAYCRAHPGHDGEHDWTPL